MPAGRKKSLPPPDKTVAINEEKFSFDQQKFNDATVALQRQAKGELADLCELAADVGALRALELTRSLVATATIRIFQKVCDSKKIKDLPIRLADGSVAMATNLDELCRLAFGRPRSAMFEASATLEALGEQTYEAASRLGLNRSALRVARALPPEKLETVRQAIAAGNTRGEVMAVIEDLAERVEKAEAATIEAKAELTARDKVLAGKAQYINRLETEAARRAQLTPDEKFEVLQKDVMDAMRDAQGAILGRLRQAIIAVRDHDEKDRTSLLAYAVGEVQAQLTELREEFNLPDATTLADRQLLSEVVQWAGDGPNG
ncbi:MAG: hypothetical protein E6Q67_14250 [Roseateles sp.]|nr:MAG: hypothetical protein E6Q67_14250 [Roseateles sp.]